MSELSIPTCNREGECKGGDEAGEHDLPPLQPAAPRIGRARARDALLLDGGAHPAAAPAAPLLLTYQPQIHLERRSSGQIESHEHIPLRRLPTRPPGKSNLTRGWDQDGSQRICMKDRSTALHHSSLTIDPPARAPRDQTKSCGGRVDPRGEEEMGAGVSPWAADDGGEGNGGISGRR